MTDISFIGLGTMGSAMAGRLVDAGNDVGVWNRSPEAADRLVARGAHRVSLEEAFERQTVLSMLSNDEASEVVFTADLLNRMPEASVHVAFESLSKAAADRAVARHADAGVAYLAAPVLGRPPVALAGALNILAGGPREVLESVAPLLDVLGSKTWYLGAEASSANLVKAAVNYNLIHTIQALSESVALVERGGVDPRLFVEVLTSTLYPGAAYTGYGAQIAERRYEPVGFSVELGLKDLSLAEQAAKANGTVLPSAPVLREMFERTLADPEIGKLDWAAIAEIVRR